MTEYTCCHCLLQTAATESRPIGLVTLIQSSSVLAHKHESTNHLVLPTTEEEEKEELPPSWSDSLGLQYDQLFQDMNQTYDSTSCLLAVHRGWKGGIHIQSCGHHMHYDCRSSYCETLRSTLRPGPRDATLDFENGEFICPMCRQVANALLPVPPDAPPYPLSHSSQSSSSKIRQIALNIHDLLGQETLLMSDGPTPLKSEMSKIVQVFTRTAPPPQLSLEDSPYPQNAAMFISSIARTNLECDIVQRGGTLVQGRGFADMVAAFNKASTSGATPKVAKMTFDSNRNKFCFVPLMHVLAIHMKVMMVPTKSVPGALSELWGALTCQWAGNKSDSGQQAGKLILRHNNVPLLMQDPLALMTHFILLLPLNVDLAYFKTVTRACFNLQLAQSLVRIAFTLSFSERSLLRGQYNRAASPNSSFAVILGQVIDHLEATTLFSEEEDAIEMADESSEVMLDINSLETEAARLLIPFLRTASLMKLYIYKENLPEIKEDDQEFDQLVKFLDLISVVEAASGLRGHGADKHMHSDQPTDETEVPMEDESTQMSFQDSSSPLASMAQQQKQHVHIINVVEWFSQDGDELKMWCSEFDTLACRDHIGLARQAMRVNVLWKQPQLLRLHQQFDQIFQFYHKKQCDQCGKVPKDPAVCLMCGTMVCMRETCCRKPIVVNQGNKEAACETVRHSLECGGGTGIFLSVNSSTIIVVRGKRACVWGSVFLDFFGEEDKELKRGKPLFLNDKRYQLLEHQWVSHKFDHTNKRWVPHRNSI